MKRSHWITAVALAAIAGAYMLGRAGAPEPSAGLDTSIEGAVLENVEAGAKPTPPAAQRSTMGKNEALPSPDMPLKDTYTQLQARADAGDAGAASRLLRDLDRCRRLRGSEWGNANATAGLVNRNTDGMSPEQLRTYQMLLDAMELRQQRARKSQEQCAEVSDEMLDTLIVSLTQAARLGDEDARACYLGRGPLYDARSLLNHPGLLQNYRNDASTMIDAGLAAGDWRVVDLLQQAYEPGAQSLLAGLVGADPVQHYRYLRLYRLGAEQHRIARLDQQLAAAAANLTPVQLADANEWAQTTLRGNFKGDSTSATPQGWEACAF